MENDILKVLKDISVFKTGHFLLPSGKHSDVYFQCASLFKFPSMTENTLKALVSEIESLDLEFDLVLSPAMGGLVMGYEIARQFNKPFIYIKKINGTMILDESFEIKTGQRILIAEDVITSGNTIKESIELIESLGGLVSAIACIINKEGIKIKQDIYSCIKLNLESYDTDKCPLCRDNIPLQSTK